MDKRFVLVGRRAPVSQTPPKPVWYAGKPLVSIGVLGLILLGCLTCAWFIPHDPAYMDLAQITTAPCPQFWFGTDTMGRDIFSMIWYGGRISLLIGFGAAALATLVGIAVGTLGGLGPRWLDRLIMRLTDIYLSIPGLLLIVFLQAILGEATIFTICLVLGLTGWTAIAKVVRTQVRQLRGSDYVIAARSMGAGFWWILRHHLAPNFLSSILFMIVMQIRSAILTESTLSFLGLGLPLSQISWGSMLSLADNALLSGAWWIIVIPGAFLVVTILCVTNIGSYLQRRADGGRRNQSETAVGS